MRPEQKTPNFIGANSSLSLMEIHQRIGLEISYATTKRLLSKLVNENLLLLPVEVKPLMNVRGKVIDLPFFSMTKPWIGG